MNPKAKNKSQSAKQIPVLVEAQKLIRSRDKKYGHPKQSFKIAADIFNALTDSSLRAEDIPLIQAILKLTRMKHSKQNRDHYVDIAGYIALMFEIVESDKKQN